MIKKKEIKVKTKDQKKYSLFKINLIILIVLLVLVLYFFLHIKPTIIGNAGGVIGVDFSAPIAAFQLDKTSMTFTTLSETQTLLVSTNDNKVYKNAYYSTGTTWNKFQLSGTTLSSGWITGAASKTLSLKASDLNLNDTNLSKTLHVITYSCTKLSRNKFDCRNNLWQLKDINVSYTGTPTQAATPVASPVAGTYTSAQSVTLTSATSGASIYYTTNGVDPTTSSTLYSSAISISATTTLKAIAVKSGYTNSSVLSATYTINIPTQVVTPVASPVAGTYTSVQSVTLTSATSGASIYYTTNGVDPTTSSTLYSSAISISATTTLKAIATKSGYTNSSVLSATYTINSGTGKTYYVSSSTGNDTYTSTQAQNPATPWRTIAKVNAYTGLVAGDYVLFNRGEIFDGNIVINKSGTLSLPITYGAYGTGNKPVINGFTTLTGWTLVNTGVYEASCISCATGLNMVTVNAANTPMGRYPNLDTTNGGYLTYESHVGHTSITDTQLTGTPNWTGAELVMKRYHWLIDVDPITNHTGSTITYTDTAPNTSLEPQDGYGYFIQNDPKTLDQLGEWYYNPSTKTLQMYFGSNSPSNYVVKASAVDSTVTISTKNYVTFDNLSFQGANIDNIKLVSANNITMQNCEINLSGNIGINGGSSSNFKLENSIVDNSNNVGVDVDSGAIIRNNVISNTALFAGMGHSYEGTLGINIGSNSLVEYNKVLNTGYNGIQYNGSNIAIRYNVVDNFCLIKDDGSGIYSWRGELTNPDTNRKIYNNIVSNGIGAPYGTDSGINGGGANGIYLDGYSTNIEVYNNTIYNMPLYGIFLNANSGENIHNNTVYNNGVAQLFINIHSLGNAIDGNVIVHDNILFSKQGYQRSFDYTNNINNGVNSTYSAYNNYFLRPVDDNFVIKAVINDPIFVGQGYTVSGWQTATNLDSGSHASPKTISPYTINSLGANKFTNGTFSNANNINGVVLSYGSGSPTGEWSNTCGLDGGCLKMSNMLNNDAGFRIQGIGSIDSTKKYIARYSDIGTVPEATTYLKFSHSTSPYGVMSPLYYSRLTNTRLEHEILLTPTENESNGWLYFALSDGNPTVYFDNIALYEANVTMTNPDDYIRFEYNDTNVPKTFSLSVPYIDSYGTIYTGNVTIQPYTSMVLIKN